MNVEQYIQKVDALYAECKEKNMSRGSVEWGKPSAKLNRELRTNLKSQIIPETEKNKWRYAFTYWTTKSQLLELYYKSKMFGGSKKKRLSREALQMKLYALNDAPKAFVIEERDGLVQAALNL